MIRKFCFSASLAGLLLGGLSAQARPLPQQSQANHQGEANRPAQQAKSVTGKVTDIGSDKKSFALEVNEKNSKRTMQFVVDGNTQVQGRVTVGTEAAVQYQPSEDWKNLALSIGPQGQGQGQGPQ
jgi:hypothetical protein